MEDWPVVVELLASHDDNLKKVESLAQREIFSIEVPVFNGLRDILPFSILTALRRMDHWFGKVRKIEHALCLVVLTDYVSCTYNQRNFYRTFENALTAKFIDSLFEKLYEEWCKIFSGRPFIQFTDSELESIRKSLSRSVDRFPESFRHKYLLSHIVQLGGKYRKLLASKNGENVNVNLPIQRPLVSSENLLWRDRCKGDSNNLVKSEQKKKSKADMTKYIVKRPVHTEPTKNVTVHKKSMANVPVQKESAKNGFMASQKTVSNLSVTSYNDEKSKMSFEKLVELNDYEDDSMDSVDIYLTRRSIYTPSANYSHDNDDYDAIRPNSLSPIDFFFKEMEQLNERAPEVSDSDEEMMLNFDSNYSEISVGDESSTNCLYRPATERDEEKMKVKCDFDAETNEVKMSENSEHSSLTISDEEKLDVNCVYVPKIVPDVENKNDSFDYLPKTVTDEEKMNVANNNSSPTSTAKDEEVISVCDCCTTNTNHVSRIPVPVTAPKKKLNAFDVLMKRVPPPKRQRFFK